jgi:hypothetical protein
MTLRPEPNKIMIRAMKKQPNAIINGTFFIVSSNTVYFNWRLKTK